MPPFLLISVSILTASVFGFLASLFRQPLIIGYIFAGILLSVLGVFSGGNGQLLGNMAHLGMTFLLFLVGLEMNVKELPGIGRVALLVGAGQMAFTLIIGFLLALFLGFGPTAALYIAISLVFSSTIMAGKLLSEKKDLNSLYGKITVGILLVQDVVAILVLIFLSGFQKEAFTPLIFLAVFTKGILLVGGVYILSRSLVAEMFDRIAMISSELLFLASISWALALSSLVSLPAIGFSIEIGGFLAGLALAGTSERLQIASRVKPLRDFFILAFFLLLGAQTIGGLTPSLVFKGLLLSLFVLLLKPFIVLVIMGLLGYKSRTSFLSAVTVAQISEFSFIIVALGYNLGHITESVVGLVAVVGVVTMTASAYLILGGHKLYHNLRYFLRRFERKRTKETAFLPQESPSEHTVLIGAGRTGSALLPVLKEQNHKLLVVDFNPDVVERLSGKGFSVMYGDSTDFEALELLNLGEARYIVSTTNSLEDNLMLLEKIRKIRGGRPLVVMTVSTPDDALALYEAGADYVVVPRIISGEHLADLFSKEGLGKDYFEKLRNRHFERLVRERF